MDFRLAKLQSIAFKDAEARKKFQSTLKAPDPMQAFCDIGEEYGVYLTPGELSVLGEESCAAMLRSQNGGGEIEPEGWNDDYSLFFLNIEHNVGENS